MKKISIAVCLIGLCLSVSAQQITRFAVIDTERLYQTFFSDSQNVRNYEMKKEQYQSTIQKMSDEIKDLRQKKVDALAAGNNVVADKYDSLIASKTSILTEYVRTSNQDLTDLRKNLQGNDEFYRRLYAAIKKIGESEGYSMVLDVHANSGIIWFSPTVDITDEVIQALSS